MKTKHLLTLAAGAAGMALASCAQDPATWDQSFNPLDSPAGVEGFPAQRGHHGLGGPNYNERMQFEGLLR